jgi:putative addiction module CopG family antidote
MANHGRDVSLTEHHSRFVDTQVEEGHHASASEVVSEALRRYEADIAAESAAIAALQAIADRSEAGEAIGDFIDIEDDDHLRRVIDDALSDAVAKVRGGSAQ